MEKICRLKTRFMEERLITYLYISSDSCRTRSFFSLMSSNHSTIISSCSIASSDAEKIIDGFEYSKNGYGYLWRFHKIVRK